MTIDRTPKRPRRVKEKTARLAQVSAWGLSGMENLPIEAHDRLLGFLEAVDLAHFSVCASWAKDASRSRELWFNLIAADFAATASQRLQLYTWSLYFLGLFITKRERLSDL